MSSFAALFGIPPSVHAAAPGRVNLIGEHTDYNGGFVLPTAIPQRTRVALAPRPGRLVRVASREAGGAVEAYASGEEARGRGWLDYVQGVTWVLREAGHRIGGFDAWITSDVPVGAGLASSAALLVALLKGLRAAFALPLDDVTVARLARRAEHDFVGARVGIMDQMACALASDDAALFLDTRDLSYRRVPLPPAHVALVVVDSSIAHGHAHGGYNTRRAECEAACRHLGVAQLRDLGPGDLARLDVLPGVLRRRARHVIAENARVLAAVEALESADMARLGACFDASHASLRDDYEVSTPEVDRLVEIARSEPAVYGARLTGGGFGGAIVALCRPGHGAGVGARVAGQYGRETGLTAAVLVPQAPDGPPTAPPERPAAVS